MWHSLCRMICEWFFCDFNFVTKNARKFHFSTWSGTHVTNDDFSHFTNFYNFVIVGIILFFIHVLSCNYVRVNSRQKYVRLFRLDSTFWLSPCIKSDSFNDEGLLKDRNIFTSKILRGREETVNDKFWLARLEMRQGARWGSPQELTFTLKTSLRI